jgi:DNA-binding response OmpR family regulator
MPTVLIVDDEPAIGQIFAGEFEAEGFTVLRATNGNDGLQLALKMKPDAVVLDIVMPGLHGYEVCKRIREDAQCNDMVIVMTSAKSYKPDIDKAFEVGADEYIVKPGDVGQVLAAVKNHLSRRGRI